MDSDKILTVQELLNFSSSPEKFTEKDFLHFYSSALACQKGLLFEYTFNRKYSSYLLPTLRFFEYLIPKMPLIGINCVSLDSEKSNKSFDFSTAIKYVLDFKLVRPVLYRPNVFFGLDEDGDFCEFHICPSTGNRTYLCSCLLNSSLLLSLWELYNDSK